MSLQLKNQPAFFKANQPALIRANTSSPNPGGDNLVTNVVPLEQREEDLQELRTVDEFLKTSCECQWANGKPCSRQFSREFVLGFRSECMELQGISRNSFDMLLSGYYSSNNRCGSKRTVWKVAGIRVCGKFCSFVHATSQWKLTHIAQQVNSHGFTGWSYDQIKRNDPRRREKTMVGMNRVKQYLESRALQEGIAIPGRIPSHAEFKAYRFPSTLTQRDLYEGYKEACIEEGYDVIAMSTFVEYWKTACPDIGMMGKYTDVCDLCRSHVHLLGKLATIENEEERENYKEQHAQVIVEHLRHVKEERTAYNESVEHARLAYQDNPDAPEEIMLTFDFAECKTFPYYRLQPQSLHFKSRRKGHLFGIQDEGKSSTTNYLFDESDVAAVGKGADCVISMIFHYLQHYVPPTSSVRLQCDNCGGQNKNKHMIRFIAWIVWSLQAPDVTLAFMVEAHSKFSCDRSFGVFSRTFTRSDRVESIHDCIPLMIKASTKFEPVLVHDYITGERNVDWYSFGAFLEPFFKTIDGIKKYHIFKFKKEKPGIVYVKEWSSSSVEVEINLLRKGVTANNLPRGIPSNFVLNDLASLTPAREWYMHDNLRQYCSSEEKADVLAPMPEIPKPVRYTEEATTFRTQRIAFDGASESEEHSGQLSSCNICQTRCPVEMYVDPQTDSEFEDEDMFSEPEDEDSWFYGFDLVSEDSEEINAESMENITNSDMDVQEPLEQEDKTIFIDTGDTSVRSEFADEPTESELPLSKSYMDGTCGTCGPCQLYLAYITGKRSLNNAGVPRSQRRKCGRCNGCKYNRKCKNLVCINKRTTT